MTFLLLLFGLLSVTGQECYPLILSRSIDISLENSGLMPTLRIKNDGQFHVDQTYKNYIIKEFYFQPLRYFYQLLKEGRIDQSKYEFYKKRYNDSGDYDCSDGAYKLQMLILLDSRNTKTIIFDVNHNQDFTDDSAYVFQAVTDRRFVKQRIKNLPIITVPITFFMSNNSHVLDTVFIRPYPYQSAFKYADEIENKFYLMIQNATSKKGYFEVGGVKYSIVVSTGMPLPTYNLPDTRIYISTIENAKEKQHYYEIDDQVKLKQGAIELQSISRFGDTVYYMNILSDTYFDPWNCIGPSINAVDINGKLHNLQFNKKLTLLDFWGTWCQPCIALLPKLRALHKSLKSKSFAVVSIAYDETKSLASLKNMVANKNMAWLNLFQNMEDQSKSSLVNKFKVTSFPTYILVDSTGKIVMRGEGKEGFAQIASFAKSLVLKR